MADPKHFLRQTVPFYERALRRRWTTFSLNLALARPETLSEEQAAVLAELGRRDFYFFLTCICGQRRLGPPPAGPGEPGGFHWNWCKRLEDPEKPLMALVARKLFKTTIQTQGLPLWRATRAPESYDHVTITDDKELGESLLQWMKIIIEKNPVYRRLYPRILPGRPWTTRTAALLNRADTARGPTFEIRTTRQAQAGRHVGGIGLDDLENDKNCDSRNEQQRLCEFIDMMWPTINGPLLTISDTPYREFGFTSYVIRKWCVGATPDIDLLAQPLRGQVELDPSGLCTNLDDGTYPFPEEYDDASFAALQKLVADPEVFAWQYMLDMSFRGEQGFQRDWIKYV